MIHREHHDSVCVLRMDHGKVQVLDYELLAEMVAALDEVEAGESRAVVLTGTGSSFSAGVDLHRIVEDGEEYVERFLVTLSAAFERLMRFPKPVVAAVNGHAIAGGMIMMLACDLRFMARGRGRIGVPELLVGVPFPAVALEILRQVAPPTHVQELVYRGRRYDVEQALARGYVHEVLDPERLLPKALEAAGELAALPAEAFTLAKTQLLWPALARLRELGPAHDHRVAEVWKSQETAATIRAYLERTLA